MSLDTREVLEAITDGFVAFDHERRILYVNAAAERLVGRQREEVVGRSVYEVFPAAPGSECEKRLDEAEATQQAIEYEYFNPASGRWYHKKACPAPWGLSLYFQDVTAAHQTRAALSVSERQYRTLIDSIDQGYCVAEVLFDEAGRGVDYRLLEINRAFEVQTGLVDSTGQRMRVLMPELEDAWFEILGRVALSGEPVRFEGAVAARQRWYDVYAFRFGPPPGRRVAMLFSDITARKQTEDALRESEERFRMLVEGMAQAVWETDAEGLPLRDSPAWRELTGQSIERWLAGGWSEMAHPDDRAEVARQWREGLADARPISLEYRLQVADGSWRWTNDRAAPLFGPDGAVRKWVGMNIDITERKRAEQGLREADRRKDEFLAILAHELRNPLAPLRTGLEIMRLAKGDMERVDQVRAMMERQIDHLVSLVDDLMDVSRISRGRVQLDRRHLDLIAVVRGALEACERIVRQRGHELTLSLPAEAVYVDGDSTRLTQALGNLLTNAAKYTESGGHIFLSLFRERDQAVICVRDTGIGIPQDMLERVFDLFMQVGSGIDRAHGGLGIGLTIVKQLVELHGGTVEAHSAGLGKGSEFIMRLPLLRAAPADDGPKARNWTPGRTRRVLVVDDNQDAAAALSTMLELGGHDVRVAFDGKQALQIAEQHRPEVILMDLGMPNLNGYDAARRIREQPWGKQALLIAVTGWGQPADRTASEQAGFDHHLVKPVESDTVQRLIARLDAR